MASQFQLSFPRPKRSPSPLDVYLVLVALAGLLVCGSLLRDAAASLDNADLTFWVLAACVLPAEIMRVTTWNRGSVNTLTMSRPFALALLTGWGAAPTVVVFVIASVVSDLIYRKPALRIPFNAGQYALSIAAASLVYTALGGQPSLRLEQVPAFIAATVVLILVNRLLVRVAVALYDQHPITVGYLLAEAQVELVEGAVQFSMVLVALLVAEHRLVLPLVLALPALPILVAGRAAERAERLSREYAEQLLRYRHLFVVADRFRRQADAGSGVNSLQLSAVALDLRASTSMLQGLLRSISREAERHDLGWLQALAGNGVEHTNLLSGKLDQLQQTGAPMRAAASVRERIDATDLVRVAEQLARTISQGRAVVTEVPAERLPVCVNQDEVLDVLGNLLLNAHRFAPPTAPIRLTVSREGASVVLAVEDDGVEFTPEQRERIFDEELQLDGSRAGRSLAHGVAMARQLAHANGGELRTVDPERADGRARFELSLPLAPGEPPDEEPASRHPEGRDPEERDPDGFELPPVGAESRDSTLEGFTSSL